ncbi:MAG: hypothetical protein HC788_04435 [Sphingopyxis sp.]|nr:hypothetical protein [Sphingopyxis sp.]
MLICRIRDNFRRSLADDPAKRAAWDLLTGPCDWTNPGQPQSYGGLPAANMNRPDVIVGLAGANWP